jgi:hypothetical protein
MIIIIKRVVNATVIPSWGTGRNHHSPNMNLYSAVQQYHQTLHCLLCNIPTLEHDLFSDHLPNVDVILIDYVMYIVGNV